MALDMLRKSLQKVNFVTISSDSSNRGNQKMLPVVVRYFSKTEGIQNKLIELNRLDDETLRDGFQQNKGSNR